MQFPRYEFVVPRDDERCFGRRPQPRPERPQRTARPVRRGASVRRIAGRRGSSPRLAIQEYLDLEFSVDDGR